MCRLAICFLLLFPLASQADLFKCTDDAGKVTYTNFACAKSGLKENKLIPSPPPPALDTPPSRTVESARPAIDKNTGGAKSSDAVALRLVKPSLGASEKCAKLNGDMGKIMDQLDTARQGGRQAGEETGGNDALKNLQAEKNRLGCF